MDYFEYQFLCNAGDKETLLAFLYQLGFDSFEEKKAGWIAYLPTDLFGETIHEKLKELNKRIQFTYSSMPVEEKNWNEEWERKFEPIRIESFCYIRGTFHKPASVKVMHELVIQPKMAFGTGHHATTLMMIRQMEGMDLAGKEIFDYGCGTGILSILAEKMGARQVRAIDIEPIAIENTQEHLKLNDCTLIVPQISTLDEFQGGPFDSVLANINRQVLSNSLKTLYELIKPGGWLLLSGVLSENAESFEAAVDNIGFSLQKKMVRAGWICSLYFRS